MILTSITGCQNVDQTAFGRKPFLRSALAKNTNSRMRDRVDRLVREFKVPIPFIKMRTFTAVGGVLACTRTWDFRPMPQDTLLAMRAVSVLLDPREDFRSLCNPLCS